MLISLLQMLIVVVVKQDRFQVQAPAACAYVKRSSSGPARFRTLSGGQNLLAAGNEWSRAGMAGKEPNGNLTMRFVAELGVLLAGGAQMELVKAQQAGRPAASEENSHARYDVILLRKLATYWTMDIIQIEASSFAGSFEEAKVDSF